VSEEHGMRSDELDEVAKQQTLFLVRFACASSINGQNFSYLYYPKKLKLAQYGAVDKNYWC